jgi:hypothetical protein
MGPQLGTARRTATFVGARAPTVVIILSSGTIGGFVKERHAWSQALYPRIMSMSIAVLFRLGLFETAYIGRCLVRRACG